MADYWDQYEFVMTPEQALAPMGRQLLSPTATRTPTPTATPATASPSLAGNTMGMTPEQEAAVRQWSATGGQAGGGTTTQQGNQTPLQFLAEWQQKYAGDASEARYQELAREMKTRFGIDPAPGANGPSRNEFMINGEKVKVRSAEDSGSPQWFAYGADDGWRPGGETGGLPGGYSLDGSGPLSSFSAPGLAAPWTQEFQARDPQQIANDPAYQFQLQQGMQALNRDKAAQGTIYTGGALKDLNSFAQGLASTYNDKYYNRDINEYMMNRDSFWNNQNNAFNKLSDFSQLGLNAATATGNFGSGYANNAQTGATNLGNLATNQANANAGATIAGNNATNAALGGIANAAGEIDWSRLFRRG